MKLYCTHAIFLITLTVISTPAYSGSVLFGLNLEFVEGQFNDNAFDGGLGFQVGYEFKRWKNWNIGTQFEYLNGWNSESSLYDAGDMTYDSASLFATARRDRWPLLFKAGIVNANYKVLRYDDTQNYRKESDFGYAYGITLVYPDRVFSLNLLDVKWIRIGSDSFISYGISVGLLFGK